MPGYVDCERYILQGDIFTSLTLPGPSDVAWEYDDHDSPAIVISSSCDVSKPADLISVAKVLPLAILGDGYAGNVRRGRVQKAWFLAELPTVGDAYVDLSTITPIASSWLHATRDTSLGDHEPRIVASDDTPQRLCRLDEADLTRMMNQVGAFLLRPLPIRIPRVARLWRRIVSPFRQ